MCEYNISGLICMVNNSTDNKDALICEYCTEIREIFEMVRIEVLK